MRVFLAIFCCWLLGCSAAETRVDWRARAAGAVGIEDFYRGCSTEMVFVPAEVGRLREWVPESFAVREPGRVGVAGFNCRYSEMEQGPISFAMVVVMVEKPERVFDPGLADFYEVARVTLGSRQREMLAGLGYRMEEQNQMFPHTAWELREYQLKGMHVRVWHQNVYTLMHFSEHRSSIGAVSNCKIREGSLVHEIAGQSSCNGGTAQTAAGVDFSLLIRL